jgi:hypothetical protein
LINILNHKLWDLLGKNLTKKEKEAISKHILEYKKKMEERKNTRLPSKRKLPATK